MNRLIIYIFALAIIIASPLSAQEVNARFLTQEEISAVTNSKSFWRKGSLDRVFFNSNGHFTQQLNDDSNNIPSGTILEGAWEISENNLCWT